MILTDYIHAAMKQATYELLEDGTFYGEIPPCKGVLSNAAQLKECQELLQEVLEEWIILGLKLGHNIPVIEGIDLNFNIETSEVA
jgi:predicted RNase H-like HicB family nuclease